MVHQHVAANDHARILIVKDEIILAKELLRGLNALGYDVVGRVASEEEAVKVAQATLPELVLMDIRQRGRITGVEAARLDTAIVYLTGYSD